MRFMHIFICDSVHFTIAIIHTVTAFLFCVIMHVLIFKVSLLFYMIITSGYQLIVIITVISRDTIYTLNILTVRKSILFQIKVFNLFLFFVIVVHDIIVIIILTVGISIDFCVIIMTTSLHYGIVHVQAVINILFNDRL